MQKQEFRLDLRQMKIAQEIIFDVSLGTAHEARRNFRHDGATVEDFYFVGETSNIVVDEIVAEEIPTDGNGRIQVPNFFGVEFAPKPHAYGRGRCVYEGGVAIRTVGVTEKGRAMFFFGEEIFLGVGT